MTRRAAIFAGLVVAWTAALAQPSSGPSHDKPMSVHNRLLLNRLTVAGYQTLEVMLALEPPTFDRIAASIVSFGGTIRRAERAIAYIRAEIPIETLTALVADSGVAAYQISSLSRASWYRDGAPEQNATMFRSFEVGPAVRA